MKIAVFANNKLGVRVVEWLVRVTIAALVLHPQARCTFGAEICAAAGSAELIDGSTLGAAPSIAQLCASGAELGLSVLFGYRLPRAVIDLFPRGCFNLHPAYLPYNRGADPNVWSIVEGTPAGVTLHWMDDGIDTGDIVAQERVHIGPADTGRSLYLRL